VRKVELGRLVERPRRFERKDALRYLSNEEIGEEVSARSS
jgi:hypothetical protein